MLRTWSRRPIPVSYTHLDVYKRQVMILPVGFPAPDATVPAVAKRKKPLDQVLTVFS